MAMCFDKMWCRGKVDRIWEWVHFGDQSENRRRTWKFYGGLVWIVWCCIPDDCDSVVGFSIDRTVDCPNNVGDAVYLIGTQFLLLIVFRSIKEARLALDAVCPPLPSADNVTRDVMEQLQEQMTLLRNGQQQSLDSLGKSQATLVNLEPIFN